jgi:hypothetical protein
MKHSIRVVFAWLVAARVATLAPRGAGPATCWRQRQPKRPLPSVRTGPLVTPIALYPDALVAQILMATTYPLESSEAALAEG